MRHRTICVGVGLAGVVVVGAAVLAGRGAASAHRLQPGVLFVLVALAYLGAWGVTAAVVAARRAPGGVALRFSVCTASLLAALSACELPALVGAVDYRAAFATPAPAWERPGNRPDPDLLFVREGPRRFRATFRGNEFERLAGVPTPRVYAADVRYDRNGFRNPAGLTSAPVVVLGDSFIEGLHVADAELITAHLADLLGKPVANLGRSGYGPQQELYALRRYALGLRPKTCVWAFYEGNDLEDAHAYASNREAVLTSLRRGAAGAFFGRSLTRNALAFAIRTWLDPVPPLPARRFTGWFAGRSGTSQPIYFANGDYRRGRAPGASGRTAPGMAQFRAALADADRLCRSRGVALVVVFIPTKYRVYRDRCTFAPGAGCLRWPLDDLPGALAATVAGVSGAISFLDLTPEFAARADAGSLLYLPDDTHWSPDGHRAAAETLAAFLARE